MSEETRKMLNDFSVSYDKKNGKTIPCITQDQNFIQDVRYRENVAKKVIASTGNLFEVVFSKHNSTPVMKSTRLGNVLLAIFRTPSFDAAFDSRMLHLNPYVTLLLRAKEGLDFDYLLGIANFADIMDHSSRNSAVMLVKKLNEAVELIRKTGKSSRFTCDVDNRSRAARKDCRSLISYMDALFNRYSRLMVIRLDFSYIKNSGWLSGCGKNIGYDDVKSHRTKLFRDLPGLIPEKSLVGYAWKLEYGHFKSFHYHVIIVLDGSKVREDVTIAKLIGEHWVSVVTDQLGLYYNCNAFKDSYKSCGIGMINHGDHSLRKGLENAALYMTKPDYYVKAIIPGNGRTFGRGVMPKERTTNRGRPRSIKTSNK